MANIKVGDTVTVRSAFEAIVVGIYSYQGQTKISVKSSKGLPVMSYSAHEVTAYSVKSPDLVIVKDDDGTLWAFDVLDVLSDMSGVYIKSEGKLLICPMRYVLRVIPSSMRETVQA